ncbi:Solitary outer membrane autotransporter beta-barrel domain [Paraferrimonas haliotis]|uniref:Solitary outer membrane autotransporter-like beta-barrel domain-containing protein n=1 Tax=Paraferrimonas haliotis TaxID=2013866 RepID=A0AA37WX57_9GAMM|nr:Solitary outer membrane autotransporter beta-barrel domain [Paraferrimonas haliotis]GLS84273.1 hypothetical protein GCM10007894_22500 [Paraferrimonas haliotis]
MYCSIFSRHGFSKLTFAALAWGLSAAAIAQVTENIDATIQSDLAGDLALASLVHDKDTLSLGFKSFDPNRYLPIDDDNIGSAESIQLQSELTTITLPYTWELSNEGLGFTPYLNGRLGLLERRNNVALFDDTNIPKDRRRISIYSGYFGGGGIWQVSDSWSIDASLGAFYQRYENVYRYGSDASEAFKPIIDGYIANFDLNVWQLNPAISAQYDFTWNDNLLQYRSRLSYNRGRSFDTDLDAHDFTINSASWRNSLFYFHPFGDVLGLPSTGIVGLSRIDLKGDVSRSLDTGAFYELHLDYRVDIKPYGFDLFDNLTFGLLINYGSSLKGASLTFSFND